MYNLDEIAGRWEPTGLLAAFPQGSERKAAFCLEAQRLINEKEREPDPQFKRLAIPIVVRALAESKVFAENEWLPGNEACEVYFLKAKWNPPKIKEDVKADLDAEAEYTAMFAKAVREEFDDFFKGRKGNTMHFGGIEKLTDGSVVLYYA